MLAKSSASKRFKSKKIGIKSRDFLKNIKSACGFIRKIGRIYPHLKEGNRL